MFATHRPGSGGWYTPAVLAIIAGCRAPGPRAETAHSAPPQPRANAAPSAAATQASQMPTSQMPTGRMPVVRPVAFQRPAPRAFLTGDATARRPMGADEPFAGQAELALPRLLNEVLVRNQTLQAMRAAWLAAAERYPQAKALDDPVFMGMLAPGSLNSAVTSVPGNTSGYIVGGAQKIPWHGKRSLRGEVALDESLAARQEAEDARLQIIEATGLAYTDYYLVRQELALNGQNRLKLREFQAIAARRYEANLAPQQDVLQAEVELAELDRRQIELKRFERISIARLNTLMHRPPDAYLPPAPARLDAPPLVLSAARLRATAIARRPDLAALGAKLRAEQARMELARKEFLPDFEVFGRYDNFWTQGSLRGQVGLNMNVPLYREKRYAAVREAQCRVSQRRAEYEQRLDDINREVQTAYEQLDEAQRTVGLYRERILPAARKNVDSAFAAYEAGRGDFLRLIAAQRQRISLEQRHQQAVADYHRRRTELERVGGQPLSAMPAAEEIPPGR